MKSGKKLIKSLWLLPVLLAVPAYFASAALTGQQVYDQYCAGCHKLGTYDSSGSPDLIGDGSKVSGKYTAGVSGHKGITLSASDITNVSAFLNNPTTTVPLAISYLDPSGRDERDGLQPDPYGRRRENPLHLVPFSRHPAHRAVAQLLRDDLGHVERNRDLQLHGQSDGRRRGFDHQIPLHNRVQRHSVALDNHVLSAGRHRGDRLQSDTRRHGRDRPLLPGAITARFHRGLR